ncbi:MAG: pyridoxamine 5'-phosphate oxidase family protein [Anaerolineae bacterium]
MLTPIVIPKATPVRKIPGYGMPEDEAHLVTWHFVAEQMAAARHYWLGTVSPMGGPHVVPVWGIWVENRLHFEGSMQTMWARYLTRNPQAVVHLADGEKVIMLEGVARIIGDDDIDADGWRRLDTTFQAKYGVEEGSPYWCVEPRKVLAWDGEQLHNMTRWMFG